MMIIDRHGEAAYRAFSALSDTDCVKKLESALTAYSDKRAVAVCSVDAAIHTALHLCGVADGDYVFVPTFTFYSYIASVDHTGGVPVFLDCEPNTRCVSASALETALLWAELQNKPPKAVIVDNAFGSVADYDVLLPMCKAHGVPLVELAADAFFGDYKGRACGANGDIGIVGFDKRLLGGGGALILGGDDDVLLAKRFIRAEYSDDENHDYRLHNVVAALDCAQMDVAPKLVARARKNLAALMGKLDCIAPTVDGDAANFALVKKPVDLLRGHGFDVKKPPLVHTLPRYSDCFYFEHEPGFSVCRSFDDHCLVSVDISPFARARLLRLLL